MTRRSLARAGSASTLQVLSVQTGLAARVCVFAVSPLIIVEAWRWILSSVNALQPGDLAVALLLAVVLAGFLEPLRDLIVRPEHHGAQAGIGSFVLTAALTLPVVLLHGPLERHFHHGIDRPLNVVLGQGLIALFVTLAWLAQHRVFQWILGAIGLCMPLIAGYRFEWAADETWSAFFVCLVISALVMPRFRPWDRESLRIASGCVLLVACTFLMITLLLHAISDHIVALPYWLLYEGSAEPASVPSLVGGPVWWTTWLEDLLFYGGWAPGLFVHRGRTPASG